MQSAIIRDSDRQRLVRLAFSACVCLLAMFASLGRAGPDPSWDPAVDAFERVRQLYDGAVGLSVEGNIDLVEKGGGDLIATPNQQPLGGTNEPTIAVNPLNSLNVAAASLFSLRISNDGGVTWQAAVPSPVPATHSPCGDPSLAFDSQGRLFWSYLGCVFNPATGALVGIDVFIARCNPATGAVLAGYPVNVTAAAPIALPAANGFVHDKEWLAADCSTSPFRGRLYLVWTEFIPAGTRVITSYSANQGLNWTAVVQLSVAAENFVWPAHNTVAPNGDVYAAYHSTTFVADAGFCRSRPDGVNGQVFVCRSVNGGVAYAQKNAAYGPGQSDMTYNVQTSAGKIPRARFWLQGSLQPWVLADPIVPGRIYVIANDDPDNNTTIADYANVYSVTSVNNGVAWGLPARVDHGPGAELQVMPTAAIDKETGCIVVHWYDNRNGGTNAAGNWLLDVFSTVSHNGTVTWIPDFQVNNNAFDPDLGAPCRFDCLPAGPPCSVVNPTLRIGEYNGVALGDGTAHVVYCGNTAAGQQTIYDRYPCDGLVAIELESFAAVAAEDAVLLTWRVGRAGGEVGFDVYRSDEADGSFKHVGHVALVQGEQEYAWTDGGVAAGATYFYKLGWFAEDGDAAFFGPTLEVEVAAPRAFVLQQNVPNPFNPQTMIAFGLAAAAPTRLVILDAAGRLVRTLVDRDLPAGRYAFAWNGTDDGGRRVASGVYFYRLWSGSSRATRSLVLLK